MSNIVALLRVMTTVAFRYRVILICDGVLFVIKFALRVFQ